MLLRRRSLLLSLPALALSAPRRARAQPTPDRIDFDFVQDRQILFPIAINGRLAEAWLDSGASATVLDAGFARSLGLTPGGAPVTANGVAGHVAGAALTHVDMRVGHLLFPHRQVAVIDLAAVSAVVQRPVEVILGRDVFDHAVVDIDFQSRTLELLPRETFQPPGGQPTPLSPSGGLRTFPVRIAGVATPAVLDLGNAGAVLMDRGFADAHRLLAGRRVSTQLAVGADGPREGLVASLDDVEVGGVAFDGVPVAATENLASTAPANIGLAILSRFRLTIDFAGDRLWLAPYPGAAAAPFRKNRSGLSLLPEGARLRVTHVARGSPAAAGRWRAGDVIVAIDGQPITPAYAASPLSQWSFGDAGTVVALTLAGGARRRLRLADYY